MFLLHNEKKNQPITIDLELTRVIEIEDKNIKTIITKLRTFKKVKRYMTNIKNSIQTFRDKK